jgi:hypothetical protein
MWSLEASRRGRLSVEPPDVNRRTLYEAAEAGVEIRTELMRVGWRRSHIVSLCCQRHFVLRSVSLLAGFEAHTHVACEHTRGRLYRLAKD